MSRVDDIFNIMCQHDRKWRIDGRLAEPSFDDVQRVYTKMLDDVADMEESVTIQCGGIMLVKDAGKTAVYVYIGDADEDSGN